MIIKNFNPANDLIFNLKVVEACKSCKRYGQKGSCPPHIENTEYYQELLKKYKNGRLYINKFVISDLKNWVELGRESSLMLSKMLLKERQSLFDRGHYYCTIFGGGSCKQCLECSIPCKNPQLRIIPFEATGIDVVAMLGKQGIIIKFPVKNYFYRIGAIFYD